MGFNITRRQILALSAAMAASSVIATSATFYSWWTISPHEDYKILSLPEAKVLRALGGAAYPPGESAPIDGAKAGLDRFFDELRAPST